jgi:hypothetical protein
MNNETLLRDAFVLRARPARREDVGQAGAPRANPI